MLSHFSSSPQSTFLPPTTDSYYISCYRSYGRADEFIGSIKSELNLYLNECTPNDEKEKIVKLYVYDIEENIIFLFDDILEYFSFKNNETAFPFHELRQENKIADFILPSQATQWLSRLLTV